MADVITNPRKLEWQKAYVALLDARDDANRIAELVATMAPADLETAMTTGKTVADVRIQQGSRPTISATFSKYTAVYLAKNMKTIAPIVMDLISEDILNLKDEAELEAGLNGLTSTPVVVDPPVITSPLTATGTTNTLFTYQIMADHITGPGINSVVYSLATGAPTWLTVNANTGLVQGTPPVTDVGTNQFGVVVTTNIGSDTKTVTLEVSAYNKPVITPGQAVSGTAGTALSYTMTGQYKTVGQDGVTSVTWSSSDLPAGLSIDAATGVISGTPTADGSTTSTVNLVNDFGSTDETVAFTIAASA